MDATSFLKEEVIRHEESLAVNGVPHIDYVCKYQQIKQDEMIQII